VVIGYRGGTFLPPRCSAGGAGCSNLILYCCVEDWGRLLCRGGGWRFRVRVSTLVTSSCGGRFAAVLVGSILAPVVWGGVGDWLSEVGL